MNLPDPKALAIKSVTQPALAASELMALQLPRNFLWAALILMAALQAILFTLSEMLSPSSAPVPSLFFSPFAFFAMAVGVVSITVYALSWCGRILGGSGSFDDVMVLIVWLQGLRVSVQAVALVLTFVVPFLAFLLVLAASVAGLYITLHFINTAHNLNSIGRAMGVLFMSVVMIVLGLSVLLTIVGAPFVEATTNV